MRRRRTCARSTTITSPSARRLDARAEGHEEVPGVWHLGPNRVIAGMSVVGMWQNRFESILEFVRRPAKNRKRSDVPLVDNPVALLRVGRTSQNRLTLSDVLEPYLERREAPLLLEAAPEAWKRVQEMDRGFADLFQAVRLPEPDRTETLRVVFARRAEFERRHGCAFGSLTVVRTLELLQSWRARRGLPGSAVDVLQQLALRPPGAHIGPDRVDEAFRAATRLPAVLLDPAQPLTDDDVRQALGDQLVGQEEAVTAMADVIHAAKARLGDPDRPLATLLFAGPTGVGKTEAARAIARYLFGDDEGLVRLDMNEFIDGGAAARLVGDIDSPEGLLAGRVRHRPWCVLLFDEIEKAHPAFFDALLALMDEGILADAWGRVTDFRNSILVLTTNLGRRREGPLGFGPDDPARFDAEIRSHFRPEFTNRLDQIVVFRPLSDATIRGIARKELSGLETREGFRRRELRLGFSEALVEFVASAGFDPVFGARPLQRAIERHVVGALARHLLAHPKARGRIVVGLRDGGVVVEGSGQGFER